MTITEIYKTMEYGPAPESSKAASDWIEGHGRRFQLFIDGEWCSPVSGEEFETVNPATGETLARISQAGAEDVAAAVAASRRALPVWQAFGCHGRARFLYAMARQVQKHSRLLAVLETLDNGKPIRESRDLDVPLAARHFYHHAGWAQLLESEFPGCGPVGVVGQIIPWNFPLLMLAWKIAPALAAGNTVVLKPAEFTPLTALAFAEICMRIGLPPGVVNIVTGDGTTGQKLVAHPDVDKIAFTGSTEVGRAIREKTSGTGKRLSLELGGKSPFIVFEDADHDSAVEGLVDAIWFNQGEVCCAGSRLLIQESVSDQFLTKLRARMETLRIGDPLDKATDVGAIIADVQLQKIDRLVREGQEEGARCWQPSCSLPESGYFYPPTLITNVSPASTIAQVEVFGPVLVAMTFRTPVEAIELANNTRYGLAASVWSENINLSLDVAKKLKAGTVWVNSTNLFDAAAGFGGYRESGYGREGGKEGMWEYLQEPGEGAVSVLSDGSTGSDRSDIGDDASDGHLTPRPLLGARLGSLGEGANARHPITSSPHHLISVDRTPKLYIGGKQARPDSGYSVAVHAPDGTLIGEVGEGNRKDVRNAVEAARAAKAWSGMTAHGRAQVLYYLAENLDSRRDDFVSIIRDMTGKTAEGAKDEVAASIELIFTFAAWADKFDGAVHATPIRGMTLALPEPIGVIGIGCPAEQPLAGLLSTVLPAIAMGNRVVAVASEKYPLAAVELYHVLDTSDMPGGVVNILTGPTRPLIETLAAHDDVEAVWFWGDKELGAQVQRLSTGNLKQTWVHAEEMVSSRPTASEVNAFLRHATQVKNIWIPFTDEVSW
jgi:aldehyde dehydrogenase (NAD+)